MYILQRIEIPFKCFKIVYQGTLVGNNYHLPLFFYHIPKTYIQKNSFCYNEPINKRKQFSTVEKRGRG